MALNADQPSVAPVLAGDGSYDLPNGSQQATVREFWAARIIAQRDALNYEDAFDAAGGSYSEADEHGRVVPGASDADSRPRPTQGREF